MEFGYILVLILVLAFLFLRLRKKTLYDFVVQLKNNKLLNIIDRNSIWLILFFSFIVVLSLFGRITAAKWNIFDDHEIMLFLGPDGKLLPNEIIPALSLTEVGNFGSLPRYRPSYYVLRIMESAYCGSNPFCWHANRLIILWLGISLTWILVRPRLGWIGGGILCAYILTFHLWVDTIGRLGAGEAYTVLGLPLYIWGMVNAFRLDRSRINQIIAGFAIFMGSVICIGSKENFLLLLIPSIYIVTKSFQVKRHYIFLSAMGSIVFSLFVGIAVILLVARTGADVYDNSISPLSRLHVFLNSISNMNALFPIVILVTLMVMLGCISLVRRFSGEVKTSISQTVFWLSILLTIYCSQIVFYSGAFPLGNRYDYPGILYIPAGLYVLYILMEKILARMEHIIVARFISGTVFGTALFLTIMAKGYMSTTQSLDNLVALTTKFTDNLTKVTSEIRQKPDYAVIIDSEDVWDYEPVMSYGRFLKAYGVKNSLYLRINCYSPETVTSHRENIMATDLVQISTEGNSLFTSISKLENSEEQCFSLNVEDGALKKCTKSDITSTQCISNE